MWKYLLTAEHNWDCTSLPRNDVDEARLNNWDVYESGACAGKEKSAQNLCRPVKAVRPKGWSSGGSRWNGGRTLEICWMGDKIGGFWWTNDELEGIGETGDRIGGTWYSEGPCWGSNKFAEPIIDTGAWDLTDRSSISCAGRWGNIVM